MIRVMKPSYHHLCTALSQYCRISFDQVKSGSLCEEVGGERTKHCYWDMVQIWEEDEEAHMAAVWDKNGIH